MLITYKKDKNNQENINIKATKKLCFFNIVLVFGLCLNIPAAHASNDAPNGRQINSIEISGKIIKNLSEYINYKVNGICLWWDCDPFPYCKIYPTLELDQYLPDMVVSVYTGNKGNPNNKNSYFEASLVDDIAYSLGNSAFKSVSHSPVNIENGNSASLSKTTHYDSLRVKSVSVTGSPFSLFRSPFLILKPDTTAYFPYYYSDLDFMGRLGVAEALRPESLSLGNVIGSNPLNHWGYEFPRNMNVDVYNNYKAAAIVAQRAADIVTNLNFLHAVHSTSNTCGDNCVVANVIEEQNEKHEKWQMVYPSDRHVHIGEGDFATIDSLGREDEAKGNGNYVFVLWRHYQGCIQGGGHLIGATRKYGDPVKR